MNGSTYISDPSIWKKFYKNMTGGKFNPYNYRNKQRGGGIANMYSTKPYMIPVNPHIEEEQDVKIVVGKNVTPTEAVEDRSKAEYVETVKAQQPHVPVDINTEQEMKTASMTPNVRQRTPRKRKASAIRRKRKPNRPKKRQTSKKIRKNPAKKIRKRHLNNIFKKRY